MCSKMTRLYSKFISEMAEHDVILRCLSNVMPTYCFKVGEDNLPKDYVSLSSAQDCPQDRMVSLIIGPRRQDYTNHLCTMTGTEYNQRIRNRSGFTQDGRMMAWRNYIIDHKLMWKLTKIVFEQVSSRHIDASYIPNKPTFEAQATKFNGRAIA